MTGLGLVVPDVTEATRLLVEAFGARADVTGPDFVQVDLGGLTIMLSRTGWSFCPPRPG